ncbi:hypothetical protein VPNG_04953 [Cytospora leucostoma]|uniref:Uncharacterized protein n=1 Tax=Cytospora leucostoma TaxID=1230097 RepID=A0A423X772_9PEZI|nr:hypothetical protein VPNG_04953 [Cytospora leucostoma]
METIPSDGFPRAVAPKDESFAASMCRDARLENTTLGTRRKDIRNKITVLREKFKRIECDYWRQYHLRLDATDKGASTTQWISNFATKEGAVAKQTKERLDEVRRQIQGLELQLQKADDEFWGNWQHYMTKIASISCHNSDPPKAPQMSKPSLPSTIALAPKASRKLKNSMAPPSQPRKKSLLPSPAHPNAVAQLKNVGTEQEKNMLHSQARLRRVNNRATSDGDNVNSSALPLKVDDTTPSRPTHPATGPLAPPVFFPYGPPPAAESATKEPVSQLPAPPTTKLEPSAGSDTDSKPRGIPARRPPFEAAGSTTSSRASSHDASTKENYPSSQGVRAPQVGQVYKAYYKDDNHEGWWMCTVLPTLPAHESEAWMREVGISFPSPNIDIWYDAPKCYDLTIESKRKAGKWTKRHHVITGWHAGYGDGQPLETQRAFPVLFFEDRKGVQGHYEVPMPPKKFTFKPHAWDWVEAKNLRPVDADVGPVHGTSTADKFVKRLEALRNEDNSSRDSTPIMASADQEERAAKRPRIRVLPRTRRSVQERTYLPETNGKQEDIEMADSGSLSGDTIAASSTHQSDDELSKPLRVKPSGCFGLDGSSFDQNDGFGYESGA